MNRGKGKLAACLAALLIAAVPMGCAGEGTSGDGAAAALSAEELLSVEIEYPAAWPENDMTALVPQPGEGELSYVRDGSDSGWYEIVWEEICMEASEAYLTALEEAGYTALHTDAGETSMGTMLEKNGTVLSVAYSEGVLNLLIITGDA